MTDASQSQIRTGFNVKPRKKGAFGKRSWVKVAQMAEDSGMLICLCPTM